MIIPNKRVKIERNEHLTPSQYKLFREVIAPQDVVYRLFFDFMYFLGLRPIEVAYIKYDDIKQDTKVLHYITAKTNIYSKKPIPEPLFTELKDYLENNKIRFVDGYIFMGYKGKPIEVGTARRKFRHYIKKVKLDSFHRIDTNMALPNAGRKLYDYRLYSLRHSYTTNALLETNDMVKTSKMVGHTKMDTTYQYYIDLDIRGEQLKVHQAIADKVFSKT